MTHIPQKLYGIIGHPLGHTMSPALHNWGFELFGIAASYMAFPTEPEKLTDFITACRTLPISGASVTIPHKETVMPLLDEITNRARAVGAVNTLFWKDGKLWGENTDVTGFMHPLHGLVSAQTKALVLGAGGAAKAVLAGLSELGVTDVVLTNRSKDRAKDVAAPFAVPVADWEERNDIQANLIINSTPLGMAGRMQEASPIDAASFHKEGGIAYDLVYNPLQTVFLQQAAEKGWQTLDGLHMFAAQGIEQFKIWTGEELEINAVRDRIQSILSL